MPYRRPLPHIKIRTVLKQYWISMRKYWWWLIIIIAGTAGQAVVLGVVRPLYYKDFFDILSAAGANSSALPQLSHLLILLLAYNLIAWVCKRVSVHVANRFQPQVTNDLADRSFKYLMDHSYGFFSNNFMGALSQRVRRFSGSFTRITDSLFFDIIPIFVKVVGVIAVLFVTRQNLIALAVAVWIVVNFVFAWIAARLKVHHGNNAAAADSVVTATISDILVNHTTVQLFNTLPRELKNFSYAVRNFARLTVRKWDIDAVADAVQALFGTALEFVIFWIALSRWGNGAVTVGVFILVQIYIVRLSDDLWRMSRIIRDVYDAFSDAKEMVEILETPHEVKDIQGAQALVVTEGRVTLRDVRFSFNEDREVLRGVNIDIKAHERVAFIGPSGAGKSTLVRLLLRLYDIKSGTISIDEQDIAKVTQGSLRETVSFVPQDPVLFHRSLKENIAYGKQDATEEEVIAAAKLAHCHEFITSFPEGYNTFVGERGVKLSGGERQRVAIARAILKNAPILVLDEATSSLDSHSEALIQEATEALMKGKTVIVIAHRLSTIRKMDRIIVINHGIVTEEGSHDALLEKNGLYAKLWSLQSGGFIKDVAEDEVE